jgi:hypothetical protein
MGDEVIVAEIENMHFISPHVKKIESRKVEWSDEHPLNKPETCDAAYREMFDDTPLDGTEFAHPAYWRGQESGVDGACMRIEEVLDGKYSGAGVLAHPRLENLVRRLDRMMKGE